MIWLLRVRRGIAKIVVHRSGSPELEAAIDRGVATGLYASAEEYLSEAVELLQERDQCPSESLEEEQREKRATSLAEAERGEVADERQIRAEMRATKAEWVSQHRVS